MPVRLIREDILTSERVEMLEPPAEVFYRRLLSKVDDYGLYDARPSILRATLFPLRVDRVREADCSRWLAACESAGLIALYSHHDKPYLQALRTKWQTRSEPKYPLPPWGKGDPPFTPVNSCLQEKAVEHLDVVVDVDVDGGTRASARPKPRKKPAVPLPADFSISDRVAEWAKDKGHTRLAERLEHFVGAAKAKGYTYVDWDEAFMNAIRGNWAALQDAPALKIVQSTGVAL